MTNGARASFFLRAFAVGTSLWITHAYAQAPSFAGSYKAGVMREDYTVESWKPEWCGPAPQSSTTNGGTIEIKIEGDELVFGGDKRGFKTSGCYESLPSLARQTHSKDLARGVWTTHCSTPPQDPRKAVVDTTVTANASSGKIDLVETAKFELVVKEGTCVAKLSRRQSLQRVGTVPPPVDPPKVEPRLDCSAPGPIERIEVIPKERSLRAGDTFVFRSSGRDAKGCSVPNSPARFLFVSADPSVNVTVEPGGKVVVAGESKEGHAKLRVEIGGKEAIIDISVVSSAQYNELLR
nr:hypothetical protein [Polyangiaceae bacterium]